MPYCSRCGVEVEPDKEKCPLCNTPIQKLEEEKIPYAKKYPEEDKKKVKKVPRTDKEKMKLAFEVSSISLLLAAIIVICINLIVSKTVDWALYPLSALIFTWLIITFPLLCLKIPVVIIIGEVISLSLFLFVLDILDNLQLNWYLLLALPIVALSAIITTSIVIGSIKVKRKIFNIPILILFGSSLLCLGLDVIIMSYINRSVTIGWSLYVLVPTVLVGLFLIYLNYRLTKSMERKIKQKLQT